MLVPFSSPLAQERFTVQSGGKGLENAKHSAQIRQIQVLDDQQDARLDAVENDIDDIADQAWKSLMQCGVGGGANGTGYKITWNPAGSGSWGCIQETDPTVKTFAKTDLPTCGAGQVLRADGTKFICTTSAGSSGFEVDPYVQDFARNTAYTINACAANQVLTITNKRLRCVDSKDLAITETDPTVQAFAKLALPSCGAGQVLTSAVTGSGVRILKCVTDTDGGFAESDPQVGTITNGKWCFGSGGRVTCTQNTPVMAEADPQVGALTNGRWCRSVSGRVVCDRPTPVTAETDPKVGTIIGNKWCIGSGGKVVCNQNKPTIGNNIDACFKTNTGWFSVGETIRNYTTGCSASCSITACGTQRGYIINYRESCVSAGSRGGKISTTAISQQSCSVYCGSCR